MSYRGRPSTRGHIGDRRGFQRDIGQPDQIIEIGSFIHAIENEMLCSLLISDKIPHFNAPVFLQNKSMIGKVDEILGPINEVYFSIKVGEGMVAKSFKKGDRVYIGVDKLLPIERFLPKPKLKGSSVRRTGASRGGRAVFMGRGGRGRGNFQRGSLRGKGTAGGFGTGRGRGGGGGGMRGRGFIRGARGFGS